MFVVTLHSSAKNHPQEFANHAKSAGADVLEIRSDITPDVSAFDSPLPLLISPRGTGMKLIKELKPSFIDLELDEELEIPTGVTVIRSFHDHKKTPALAELKTIAASLMQLKPDILKIATMIRSYDDLQTLNTLHEQIPSSQKRIILGMGPKAHLTRMLSPLKNALTYTFIEEGEESAPGQVPLSLHQLTAHCKHAKIFGILGGVQVSQSFSPVIHNTLFHRHGIDALYTAFPTENLDDAVKNVTQLDVSGFSVTAPYKRDIISFLDRLDPLAEKLQSVNTVVKKKNELVGYNTDVKGIADGYDWSGVKSVAILGSGGVIPAAIEGCRNAGVEDITVYARSKADREEISSRFDVTATDLKDLAQASVDAVLCTISDDVDLPLPKSAKIAIDLRYGLSTKFLKAAQAQKLHTMDGLPMLITQAMEQFRLFTGITPAEDVTKELRLSLVSFSQHSSRKS